MNVLFDTNVILDVLLDREPFADDAALLLAKVERSEISGYICATTVTTIHYLAAKVLGVQAAMTHVRALLSLFVVAPVNRVVLESALASGFKDFEDAVVHASALHAGARYIVTRNIPDFRNAAIPTLTPAELILHIACL